MPRFMTIVENQNMDNSSGTVIQKLASNIDMTGIKAFIFDVRIHSSSIGAGSSFVFLCKPAWPYQRDSQTYENSTATASITLDNTTPAAPYLVASGTSAVTVQAPALDISVISVKGGGVNCNGTFSIGLLLFET